MAAPTIQTNKLQGSHELTPRDDAKKIVSEILKRVDQLIRKGELDRAQAEINKAKEIDPRNVYAVALEERISILKTETDRVEDITVEIKPMEVQQVEVQHPAPSPVNETPKPVASSLIKAQTPVSQTDRSAPPSPAIKIAMKHQPTSYEPSLDRSAELESYRKALMDNWYDGMMTPSKINNLHELRSLLEITDAEHERLEKQAKRDCYRNAIVRQLSQNSAAFANPAALADLQRLFGISAEDHAMVQNQLMTMMQHKRREKVLVIDDDTRLLELLSASLEDSGFDVTALPTSDEAYALLRKFVPDLILCDINLETSTMGGFTFYEKVQEIKNVQNVPFVFLTGLTDEALVRAGKELGVDDYLMKPISEQTLISALRGKLKRFRQLRKMTASPLPAMAAA